MEASSRTVTRPGRFLLETTGPQDVFVPEDLAQDARDLAQAAAEFARKEVLPLADRLEAREPGLMDRLVAEAARMGLLGIDVPQSHGGIGLDQRGGMLMAEALAQYASFGGTAGLHAGIGVWPVLYFGTARQRQTWLGRMARGEVLSSYCLTEPGSGSDALSLRAVARPAPDGEGHLVSGSKQFISNGAISGVFTVFARLEGAGVTGFIVPRGKGVVAGAEERKLGLRGASTTAVTFDEARGEMLGEPGKGHRIAFGCLNLGRLKIGGWCLGYAKQALVHAATYAAARHQFNAPIGSFGLIQQKLGRMAARCYGIESMAYQTASLMDAALAGHDLDAPDAAASAARILGTYSVEASAAKVMGSETEAYCVDEAVQIHGGYGFIEEYPVARLYRDARGNRLYEGTNEINRLLMAGTILKRWSKGEIEPPGNDESSSESPPEEIALAHRLLLLHRRTFWTLARAAVEAYGPTIESEQEILGALSDLLMGIYALDCGLARAHRGLSGASSPGTDPTHVFVLPALTTLLALELHEAALAAARRVLGRIAATPPLERLAIDLAREAVPPLDGIALTRTVAQLALEARGYPLGWIGA